ncbi:MAG: ferredoxin--NADP reductase [Bacteroidia bacterium]|nr:ferredoxin--NADP reductase [Bacteroidia bacterium]MCX7652845.1 ferredoxin--NADP reductase [Bacteroidia bacterium]MDW8417593.1 ferredoxin--NADP reductase [Bacteroidia bacterium]
MSRFVPLRIQKKQPETPDTFSLILEKPASGFEYLPGQYVSIRVEIDGKKYHRAYSLSSSPHLDKHLQLTIKRLEGGIVSNYIWQNLNLGDTLETFPPLGNFTVQTQSGRAVYYLFVAAGSGIAPIYGMIRSILFAEPKSRILLLYGSRSEEYIIFRSELDKLVAQHGGDKLEVIHSLSRPSPTWTGRTGRISAELIQSELERIRRRLLPIEAYICGPSDMMAMAIETLQQARLPKERIHTEYFSAPLPESVTAEPPQGPAEALAIIRLDGKVQQVRVKAGQTLLAAAQEAGLDPPYACEEGICCTCRAKLYKGKVHMAVREALSDWEIEKGFILTCQAIPLTSEVEIEYG